MSKIHKKPPYDTTSIILFILIILNFDLVALLQIIKQLGE